MGIGWDSRPTTGLPGRRKGSALRGGPGGALALWAALVLALLPHGSARGAAPAAGAPGETGPRAGASAAAPGPVAPGEVWESLRYRGTNWLARFSAELEMEVPDPAAGSRERGEGDGGPVAASWVAELRTRLDSVLLEDKGTRLRAWFDPRSGLVRRLTQLSLGPSPDFKRYDFEPRGVARLRSEPAEGQSLEQPERWPDPRPSFHAYDPQALGCELVSSPAALAWWLTWGPGASATGGRFRDPRACFFLGKTLYRVVIEPRGAETASLDYQLVREGRSTQRRGRLRVERYEIVSRPIAGKLDEETLIAEIVLDAENRLPWRFVMRDGPFGIDVELDRAVLRAPSLVAGAPASGRD
jgi:hypothetical protein